MRNLAPEGVKSKKILSYTAGGWYVFFISIKFLESNFTITSNSPNIHTFNSVISLL